MNGGGAAAYGTAQGLDGPGDEEPGDEDENLITADPEEAVPGTKRRAEAREEDLPHTAPSTPDEPLRERLRTRRPYWVATMVQIGCMCSLTLSILTGGYRLEWDAALGPPERTQLRNARSAYAAADFVSAAIADGVALGTMVPCAREALACILPLGVAVNSAGKKRLIWDGRHVNRHLPKQPFCMDTLQREGRTLFEGAGWGGTADISSAYHHIPMHPDSTQFLGFEWEGRCYQFVVLPFGLSTAPFVFTTVMGHTIRFLRSQGIRLMSYLDDLIFAHASARETLSAAMKMLHILPRFGWLVHPTKCQGVASAIQRFVALGTMVCLASQTFSVPPATAERVERDGRALLAAPGPVECRALARFRGLVGSTWLSSGVASRLRVRALTAVIESRPHRLWRSSWALLLSLSAEARSEIRWWIEHLRRIGSSPIRPRPLGGALDGFIFSDASDIGVGAVLFAEGPEAASSALVTALRARSPTGVSAREVLRLALRGIEFVAPLPEEMLGASSTLREMYGIWLFIAAVCALLTGGRHLVVLDNLGCVSILGGITPAFARGGRPWGEYVSGGSPNPDLQRLALHLHDMQLDHGFTLVPVWRPRAENVRADFLSRVSTLQLHDYQLREDLFLALDAEWGPHTIDRCATHRSCQPLQGRAAGRFCSLFFHPAAVWTDGFSISWSGEVNWAFPPFPFVGDAIASFRNAAAAGTLIVPQTPHATWWPSLQRGGRWSHDILGSRVLGPASRVLHRFSPHAHGLPGGTLILAVRFSGRPALPTRAPLAGGDA